mmetsp:Transcript_23310/g.57868  ORF Transcript_23310/g.57868 Transcript_23310/m.57868 type:complete len:217 (+) Transcript_23310:162-812(+)
MPDQADPKSLSAASTDEKSASTEAAELVLREKQREIESLTREAEALKAAQSSGVKIELVSSGWDGEEMGGVDDNELDRRSRKLQAKLEKREAEMARQTVIFKKVKEELMALEAPMKRQIYENRMLLEELNKTETSMVAMVNALRKRLAELEFELMDVRKSKAEAGQGLMKIMSEYEKNKSERLQQIQDIIGNDDSDGEALPSKPAPKPKEPGFEGF